MGEAEGISLMILFFPSKVTQMAGGVKVEGPAFNRKPLPLVSWGSVVWLQETWVRSLIWKDPTCLGTTKPMRHNY